MRHVACALCLLAVASAALADPVRTGFDPALDGLPFAAQAEPPGTQRAAALVAIHRFQLRRSGVKRSPGDMTAQQQPVLEHVVKSVRYAETILPPGPQLAPARPGDPAPLARALERMRASKTPELLFLGKERALVLFGQEDGHLLLWDPASPGSTLRWPADASGLGPDPRGGEVRGYAVHPWSDFPVSKDLGALLQACTMTSAGQCSGYSSLEARVDTSADGRLVVTGKVNPLPGQPAPARVWALVGGHAVTLNQLAAGTFTLALPQGTVTEQDQVGVVAVSADGAFAGFSVARRAGAPTPGFTGALPGG